MHRPSVGVVPGLPCVYVVLYVAANAYEPDHKYFQRRRARHRTCIAITPGAMACLSGRRHIESILVAWRPITFPFCDMLKKYTR